MRIQKKCPLQVSTAYSCPVDAEKLANVFFYEEVEMLWAGCKDVTSQFLDNIFSAGSDANCVSDDPGFPMSQFLKPFKLHVSRNATMVAQQVNNVYYLNHWSQMSLEIMQVDSFLAWVASVSAWVNAQKLELLEQ